MCKFCIIQTPAAGLDCYETSLQGSELTKTIRKELDIEESNPYSLLIGTTYIIVISGDAHQCAVHMIQNAK